MWRVEYIKKAKEDLLKLDNSQRIQVVKAVNKVSVNPLPVSEGGYGKPLGNKDSTDLTGYYKIKLLRLGIRVIYKLVKVDEVMKIIVVSARADNFCYDEASKRTSE